MLFPCCPERDLTQVQGEKTSCAIHRLAFTDVFDAQGNLTKLSLAYDEIPKGSTVRVKMQGPIIKYGDACTYGADEIVAALYAASRNQNVSLIILEVDSPGGSVNAIGPFLGICRNQ